MATPEYEILKLAKSILENNDSIQELSTADGRMGAEKMMEIINLQLGVYSSAVSLAESVASYFGEA